MHDSIEHVVITIAIVMVDNMSIVVALHVKDGEIADVVMPVNTYKVLMKFGELM